MVFTAESDLKLSQRLHVTLKFQLLITNYYGPNQLTYMDWANKFLTENLNSVLHTCIISQIHEGVLTL